MCARRVPLLCAEEAGSLSQGVGPLLAWSSQGDLPSGAQGPKAVAPLPRRLGRFRVALSSRLPPPPPQVRHVDKAVVCSEQGGGGLRALPGSPSASPKSRAESLTPFQAIPHPLAVPCRSPLPKAAQPSCAPWPVWGRLRPSHREPQTWTPKREALWVPPAEPGSLLQPRDAHSSSSDQACQRPTADSRWPKEIKPVSGCW